MLIFDIFICMHLKPKISLLIRLFVIILNLNLPAVSNLIVEIPYSINISNNNLFMKSCNKNNPEEKCTKQQVFGSAVSTQV